MTTVQLALGYFKKCEDRLAMIEVLVSRAAWSDVVRESQEIMELALKGVLRVIGIDPPKLHDVGGLLVEYADKLSPLTNEEIHELAAASTLLRKEREFAFYGDVDFIPTDQYDEEDAAMALGHARHSVTAFKSVLQMNEQKQTCN